VGSRVLNGRAGREVIAATGLAILVWLALAVIAASQHHVDAGGLLANTLAAPGSRPRWARPPVSCASPR
jgi:hypothetical protein